MNVNVVLTNDARARERARPCVCSCFAQSDVAALQLQNERLVAAVLVVARRKLQRAISPMSLFAATTTTKPHRSTKKSKRTRMRKQRQQHNDCLPRDAVITLCANAVEIRARANWAAFARRVPVTVGQERRLQARNRRLDAAQTRIDLREFGVNVPRLVLQY